MAEKYASYGIPFFQRNRPANDGFNLTNQHSDLSSGVFRVGRNGLPMLPKRHELVPRPRERAGKPKCAEFADENTPFEWSPTGHASPCSGRFPPEPASCGQGAARPTTNLPTWISIRFRIRARIDQKPRRPSTSEFHPQKTRLPACHSGQAPARLQYTLSTETSYPRLPDFPALARITPRPSPPWPPPSPSCVR